MRGRRILQVTLGGALALAGAGVLAGQETAAPPLALFGEQVPVSLVNVEVYVADGRGEPVHGLRQQDFTLLEDGRPVEITHFAAREGTPPPSASSSAGPAEPRAPSTSPATATARGDPLSVVVFVDDAQLRPAHRARVLRELRGFLARQLAAGDRVTLVRHDQGLRVTLPASDDPVAVAAALDEIERSSSTGGDTDRTRRTAVEATLALQQQAIDLGEPCAPYVAQPAEGYAEATRREVLRTTGALTLLVNSLAASEDRKALLYVSDGVPLTPGADLFEILHVMCGGGGATSGILVPQTVQGLGEKGPAPPGAVTEAMPLFDTRGMGPGAYQAHAAALDAQRYTTATAWEALAAHAAANRVTFYTLQAGGPALGSEHAELGPGERLLQIQTVTQIVRTNLQDPLTLLASRTGGRAILQGDLAEQLDSLRQDFDTYYSLAFSPVHLGDGREHRLQVKLDRPGLRLRYRQSYRDKPLLERTVDRTLAALLHGQTDNPLDVAVELGEPAPATGGGRDITVRLRLPLFRLALRADADAYRGRLRLFVASGDREGALAPVRQVEIPVRIPHEQVLVALGRQFVYELRLHAGAEDRLAVAVRDELSTVTSYLRIDLTAAPAGGPEG